MILLAFLVGLLFVVGGIVLAVVRGVQLWRQAKRTGRLFGTELTTFEKRTARTERLLAENEAAGRELQEALERLRVSQARLAVLLEAVRRASARTRWLRAFLPA